MKLETYNDVVATIKAYRGSHICPWRNVEDVLRHKFPQVPEETLSSIYSQEYQRKMKCVHPKCARMADKLYARYRKAAAAAASGAGAGVLLRLAESVDAAPMLLARIILEQHLEAAGDPCSKNTVTKMLKDTSLIRDKDLALEIYLCVLHDDHYGSLTDCVNHSVGQEYERRLQRQARALGLAFRDEEQMRREGYDKTPDVRLEVPAAVDGTVVNWIESKALFGDADTHANYTRSQYLSYWNRFGCGLVIYWFGFVDEVQEPGDAKFIVRDSFPDRVTLMRPDTVDSASG